MSQDLIYSLQMVLAVVLGSVLGWQRARWGKSAGSRTFALVTAGATLFTILARFGFPENMTTSVQVAAQIVTGVGFLGAGIIFHRDDHVNGLTTAAGLWVAAAIGMAVALSFYKLAIVSTVLIFAVLWSYDLRFKRDAGLD